MGRSEGKLPAAAPLSQPRSDGIYSSTVLAYLQVRPAVWKNKEEEIGDSTTVYMKSEKEQYTRKECEKKKDGYVRVERYQL